MTPFDWQTRDYRAHVPMPAEPSWGEIAFASAGGIAFVLFLQLLLVWFPK